jgi:hypothetical protein
VLETHCIKTRRAGLACALIEQAIETCGFSDARVLDQRRRLIDLYLGDVATPEKAMPHVEELLHRDAGDARAKAAAERLLANREVASRAAAVLQEVRRKSQVPPA